MQRGIVISVTGIDGAGKSTQVAALTDALVAAGVPAVSAKTELTASWSILRFSENRWGDPFAYHEHLPATLEFFVLACEVTRYHEQVVAPAVAAGELVVWDRGPYCPVAYADAGRGDPRWIREILSLVPDPDLVVHLDLAPEVAHERLAGRPGGAQANESLDLLRRVRSAYRQALPGPPRCVVVDASLGAREQTSHLLALAQTAWRNRPE